MVKKEACLFAERKYLEHFAHGKGTPNDGIKTLFRLPRVQHVVLVPDEKDVN